MPAFAPAIVTLRAHERMREDIETVGFMATIDVLRRIVAKPCGNRDRP